MSTILGSVGLIVASMCLGGAGTYAVTHERDDGLRALRVQRHTIMLEIAERSLAVHAEAVDEARVNFEQGVVDRTHVKHVELQLHHAAIDTEIHRLNLEEVRLTGHEPNDSLAAPLVDDIDFVSARLEQRIQLIERHISAQLDEVKRFEKLVQQGMASDAELQSLRGQVHMGSAEIDTVRRKLDLRRSFLSGDLTGEEVELQSMIDSAQAARIAGEVHIRAATAHLREMSRLYEAGAISQGEMRHLKIEMSRAHAEMKLAEIELQMLETRLQDLEK